MRNPALPRLGAVIADILKQLDRMRSEFRAARQYRPAFEAHVAEVMAADLTPALAGIRDAAHSAEVSDLEAAKLVEGALADGQVTSDELPVLRRACKLIRSSAERDREISEAVN